MITFDRFDVFEEESSASLLRIGFLRCLEYCGRVFCLFREDDVFDVLEPLGKVLNVFDPLGMVFDVPDWGKSLLLP